MISYEEAKKHTSKATKESVELIGIAIDSKILKSGSSHVTVHFDCWFSVPAVESILKSYRSGGWEVKYSQESNVRGTNSVFELHARKGK